MELEAILGEETKLRGAPEHQRSAFAAKLAVVAAEAAEALAAADEAGQASTAHEARLARACTSLSLLGVSSAKMSLLRIADEGTPAVKTTLARALRAAATAEGRAVLVYLLSDEDVRADAIASIGAAPWPEVLPHLIEIAEDDDRVVPLALTAIARCGAIAGPNERNAAADFLLEQLDDDAVLAAATVALLRFGTAFPGILERARRLAGESGARKIAGLCLVAASVADDQRAALLAELAAPPKAPRAPRTDESTARAFLAPLLRDADERVRSAAEHTSKALGFDGREGDLL